MDEFEPPRRVRRPASRGASLPLIPVLVGVIVLGLAFGAGLSVLLQRNANPPVAYVTAAPLASPTHKLNVPKRTPALRLSPAPKSSPTPRSSPTPATSPSPQNSATPKPQGPLKPIAFAASPLVIAPAPLATPVRITPVPATRPPYAVPESTPPPPVSISRPRPAAPPQPTDEADSEFARLSASVVRFYLNSLARGDDASAQSVLDGPRGSAALRLSEKEFSDQSLRIVKLDAHGLSDSATVNVDLSTYKGAYFEQFSLRRSPTGAAVIIEHTFIRP
jgi:hypothetical protein